MKRAWTVFATGIGLGLVLGGPASAADPARASVASARTPLRVSVRPAGAALAVAPDSVPTPVEVDPMAGLGLLQRLALVLDAMFGAPHDAPPLAYASASPLDAPTAEILPYTGPLEAGSVVVNLKRLQIYRILDGGWMEMRRAETETDLMTIMTTAHLVRAAD